MTKRIAIYVVFLAALVLIGGCARQTVQVTAGEPVEESDYGCSYFYFLWGRQAELSLQYEEALEAYRKALICDPEAELVIRKIPILLLRLDRGQEAVAMLEEYLAKKPGDTSSRMLLARVLIGLSRYDDAEEQYRSIHRQDPQETSALVLLSELYLNQSKLAEAEQALDEVLDVNSDSYAARVLLARIYLATERYWQAEDGFDRALAMNWSADLLLEKVEVYRKQLRFDKVVKAYREILDQEPGNERVSLALVNQLLRMDREKEALAELNRLKQGEGLHGKVELSIARMYARLEKYDQAVALLKDSLARHEDPSARYLLGVIQTQREQFDEALASLQLIRTGAEEYTSAVILRVRLLRFLGRHEEAVTILEKAVEDENNRSPDMYVMLAALYHLQKKTELGQRIFDRAMTVFPENNQLLYEYGLFLDSTGRMEEAMTAMQQVISRQPTHGEALNYVGYSWADKNVNLEKALDYIKRAVELEPESGYIRDSLGWVYYRLGRLEEARETLENAASQLKNDPAVQDHLGDVYLELGRKDDAINAYRTGLSLFEENKESELKKTMQEKLQLLLQQDGK